MMKKIILSIVIVILSIGAKAQLITVSGTITDAKTGEALIGVSIASSEEQKGTITNEFGFYSIDVNANNRITISYIGFETQSIQITSKTEFPLNIPITEKQLNLKEVTITARNKNSELERHATGYTKIDLKQASSVPVLGGEKDIVKILQLMPGVKKENDGSTGMLVRGGSGDQNLVLLDDAPVYNASHLLGFFSVFNTDAIKDVSMQKGGFSANYGGRLSSVMDVRMKDGNMKKTEVNAGIGLLSARGSIEGPIVKNKISYIISTRRTYMDQAYKIIGQNMPFYFYDVNAKLHIKASNRNQFFVSGYKGKDVLTFGNEKTTSPYQADFANKLRNTTLTARWNHVYPNQKLFQHSSLIYTQFYYQLTNRINKSEMQVTSSIEDYIAKTNYDYYLNNKNHIQFGGEITQHQFKPNKTTINGTFSNEVKASEGNTLHMQEGAIYIINNQQITSRLQANYGVRLSGAQYNKTNYINTEPRVNLSCAITANQTIKGAYSRMNQYIHLVTGTSTLPSDVWYPITNNIKPQSSDQLTIGYHHTLQNDIHFTAESYYKWQNNIVEFKEGTLNFSSDNIEQDITQGKGNAYGIELLLHKKSGKWNGWVGYTLAYSTRQFDELNGGEQFYARYDRRHDLSVVGNFELNSRITFSAVFAFATGSRFTPIIGQYLVPSGNYNEVIPVPIYSKRNAAVLAPSHRLDINMVIKSKEQKRYSAEWHIGCYNAYNQTQPYRIQMTTNSDGSLKYNQVGLFGFIPSVAYNFKF